MLRDLGVTSLIIIGNPWDNGVEGVLTGYLCHSVCEKKVSASVAQLLASRKEEFCLVYFAAVPLLVFICFLVDVCGLCLLWKLTYRAAGIITNKIYHGKLCGSKGREQSKVSSFIFLRLSADRRDLFTHRNTKFEQNLSDRLHLWRFKYCTL